MQTQMNATERGIVSEFADADKRILCGLFCQSMGSFRLNFYCPSKNGECRENGIIKLGCLFTFKKSIDRSCHSREEKNPTYVLKNVHRLYMEFFLLSTGSLCTNIFSARTERTI